MAEFTPTESIGQAKIPLVNTARLLVEYNDETPDSIECPFPFEEFTRNMLSIEEIPEEAQVLPSIEKRFKVPTLLPDSVYSEKGLVSKVASNLYARISKAHKTRTFKTSFRAFVKIVEFNLTFVPEEDKQINVLRFFDAQETKSILSARSQGYNYLHFGGLRISVNPLFYAQLRPLLFTTICDIRNKNFSDAYQLSDLSRFNDGDNVIPCCYGFYPKMTISLNDKASL